MSEIFQVPADPPRIKDMSTGLRLSFDCDEIPPEYIKRIFEWRAQNARGYLTFSITQIQPEDIVDLPPMPRKEGKTPSSRLRSVLFVMYKQDAHGFGTFEQFYDSMMEKFIDHIKGKLNDE